MVRISGGLSGRFRRRASKGARLGSRRGASSSGSSRASSTADCGHTWNSARRRSTFVASLLGALRMTIRAQAARRLWQYREQGGFGVGQLRRRLAQVRPTGRRHALQRAAKRRAVQVEVEDLVLGQVPLQLRAYATAGATCRGGVRECGSSKRATCIDKVLPPDTTRRAGQVLPRRAHQRQRVYARVLVEPAVLVGEQGIQVIRRDFTGLHGVAPHAHWHRQTATRVCHPRPAPPAPSRPWAGAAARCGRPATAGQSPDRRVARVQRATKRKLKRANLYAGRELSLLH